MIQIGYYPIPFTTREVKDPLVKNRAKMGGSAVYLNRVKVIIETL